MNISAIFIVINEKEFPGKVHTYTIWLKNISLFLNVTRSKYMCMDLNIYLKYVCNAL
jgi:hypothetical protein